MGLAEDISYYKRRKVRVLNGSHTNLVAAGLWEGCSTVYDCVGAPKLRAFVLDTLEREIVPLCPRMWRPPGNSPPACWTALRTPT